jgi:hypothetical protein
LAIAHIKVTPVVSAPIPADSVDDDVSESNESDISIPFDLALPDPVELPEAFRDVASATGELPFQEERKEFGNWLQQLGEGIDGEAGRRAQRLLNALDESGHAVQSLVARNKQLREAINTQQSNFLNLITSERGALNREMSAGIADEEELKQALKQQAEEHRKEMVTYSTVFLIAGP